MDGTVFRHCLPILLLCSCFEAKSPLINDTTIDDIRQPRVSGRIVKLYSGPRPEPIYCSGEGFRPDPTNCAVFYRCVKSSSQKYNVFRFQCGPGTVYDPETEVCNHARSTKRSECWDNTASSPSTEKHQENEIPKEWSRPELPSLISTSKPVFADQHLRETTPVSTVYPWATFTQGTSSLNFGYPWSSASSQQTSTPIKKPSSKEGDQCTSDGFMGDSENCRKFYRCVGNQRGGFIRYEFSCSETTIWDENVLSCNHPWAVRKRSCGNTNSKDNKPQKNDVDSFNNEDSLISSAQHQTQISYGSKVSQTQTQISHGSVIQNQTQISYGNRNDKQNQESKQNQTQISNGSAISQSQTQIDHGNKGIQTQLQIDHSKDASQSQTQEYETTSKSPSTQGDGQSETQTPSNNSNGNECTESGFMGDKNDCKKFYRCVDNGKGGYTKYDFTCGEGTVWDTEIEACNHAWAVKKCGGKEPENSFENTVTNRPESTTSQQHTTTTEEGEDDVGYGNQNQESSQTSTIKPSSVVTENNQNEIEQTTTTKRPPIQSEGNECHSSGFMGDKNDCKKFYRCVDNGNGGYTRYEFSCGEGTVWDNQIEACNHPWAVEKCGAGSSSDIQKEPTSSAKPTMSDEYVDTSQIAQTEKEPEENIDEGYYETSSSTTTTTQKPSGSNDEICTQEGFVGDRTHCKKFYRCVDNGKGGFIKYEFSCGEGTAWDSEINTCNHEKSVKRPCSNGFSNQNEGTSNSPENSHSTSTTLQPSQTSEMVQTSEQTTQQSPDQKPSEQRECSQEGFIGNDKNCKKFYRCVDNGKGGYIKYEFTCGEGTVWDQEILGCNHDNGNKQCKSSEQQQSSSSSEGNTDNEVTTTPSSTENEQTTQKHESESPSHSSSDQCTSEGFYANPDDCKKFYRCVDNGKGGFTKYDFSCGDGTIWVQEIQACDHDNDISTCSKPTNYSSTTTTSTTQATQDETSSSESPTSGTTVSQSQQPNKEDDEYHSDTSESLASEDKCSSEGFYPNKNDCRRFYRCVDNGNSGYTKYDFSCGEGTAWDSDIQSCNHINEVESCQRQNTQSNLMQDEDSTQSSTSSSGDGTTTSTSGPCTESSKPTSKDSCEQEGYYGNSEDCKKFYRCVDNGKGGFTKYDFDCGEGTIWDQDITACNHPQDVSNPSCKQGDSSTSSTSTTSSSTESSSTTSSSSDQPTSSTTENNNASNCSQENSSKKPSNKGVNCTEAGYYSDPNDCKKFYRCVDWDGDGKRFSVYHFECGDGTIWDPALDTCNHEDSVYPPRDCSGSQSQTESIAQESTTTEGTTTKQDETTSTQSTTEETTTTKTTENTQENTTQQNEQTTSAEQTTEQSTTQQVSASTDQTSKEELTTTQQTEATTAQQTTEATTTQQTTEATTIQQTTEATTAQQTTEATTTHQTTEATTAQQTTDEQTTTQESTTEESTTQEIVEQTTQELTTSQQTTSQESSTTESTDQQSTTEQSTEGTTEQSTTENQTEGSQTEVNQTEESQTEESQTEESQTQESQTEESQTEESQTEESQTEESQTEENTTESSSSSEKECPETDDDQNVFVCPTSFKRHPKYCNLFYQCTEDDDTHDANIATFHCPNNTIYDESQVKCVEENKAEKKCNGEIAQKRRFKRLYTTHKEPIVVTDERLKCPTVGHFPFEKYECSVAFLKCQKSKAGKLRGFVYQCPQGFVYWSVSRRCEPNGIVRDCKRSYNNWNGRWEIPIERRNVAP